MSPENTLVVAVGSTNPAKVAAVRRVMRRALRVVLPGVPVAVRAVDVPSGVAAQPTSEAETVAGARERARGALQRVKTARLGVGVEGGVELPRAEMPGAAWLVSVACITDREGRESVGFGMRLALPPVVAGALRAGEELSAVVDRLLGVEGSRTQPGAVGFLTRGLVTRQGLIEVTVAAALPPWLLPELYAPEPGRTSGGKWWLTPS